MGRLVGVVTDKLLFVNNSPWVLYVFAFVIIDYRLHKYIRLFCVLVGSMWT